MCTQVSGVDLGLLAGHCPSDDSVGAVVMRPFVPGAYV